MKRESPESRVTTCSPLVSVLRRLRCTPERPRRRLRKPCGLPAERSLPQTEELCKEEVIARHVSVSEITQNTVRTRTRLQVALF
uniref:Uncharacterized protein n=1 Tax=Steinernema glaseri TaxID=37863 RepID=A0A1I7YCA4_9BILA